MPSWTRVSDRERRVDYSCGCVISQRLRWSPQRRLFVWGAQGHADGLPWPPPTRGIEPVSEPNRSTNERGFITYDTFLDTYDADVRVQESSAAMGPHVWIFIHGGSTVGPANPTNDASAHLDEEQARRVRDALDTWLKEIPERWQQ